MYVCVVSLGRRTNCEQQVQWTTAPTAQPANKCNAVNQSTVYRCVVVRVLAEAQVSCNEFVCVPTCCTIIRLVHLTAIGALVAISRAMDIAYVQTDIKEQAHPQSTTK